MFHPLSVCNFYCRRKSENLIIALQEFAMVWIMVAKNVYQILYPSAGVVRFWFSVEELHIVVCGNDCKNIKRRM
jgi:hypothetical protein